MNYVFAMQSAMNTDKVRRPRTSFPVEELAPVLGSWFAIFGCLVMIMLSHTVTKAVTGNHSCLSVPSAEKR